MIKELEQLHKQLMARSMYDLAVELKRIIEGMESERSCAINEAVKASTVLLRKFEERDDDCWPSEHGGDRRDGAEEIIEAIKKLK